MAARTPEILAPAGSPDALVAAVRCGADAVYLGGAGFNARRGAQNFDAASLREAVAFCHARGVKVHLALNTLIRETELAAALALAEEACSLGVDALIVQDLGLARRLRAAAPAMPLHASTQLSCHTPAGVRALAALGFSRVVLAREMTREELGACTGCGAELEVFVHGALCMCVSGQCALSAMLGGRSGNRGGCAQPCRLPFSAGTGRDRAAEGDAALSLRDLSLIENVGELAALGVASLKIEGRMKRPEYVAAATACCVAARDGALDPALLRDLQSVFSRSGFTDSYYKNHIDRSMFGVRRHEDVTAAAPVLGRLARLYDREIPRVEAKLTLQVDEGEPVRLTARDDEGHAVEALGAPPEPARERPLDPARAAAQLSKTGGTPFTASVCCAIGEALSVPAAALNALRREALDRLLRERERPRPVPFDRTSLPAAAPAGRPAPDGPPALVARVSSFAQIPEETDAALWVAPLSTPDDVLRKLSGRGRVAVEVSRGLFGREQAAQAALHRAAEAGCCAALCGNVGAFALARKAGLPAVAGFGMNLTNREALRAAASLGAVAAVLSQELSLPQTRFAVGAGLPAGLLAYGRQPLMLMRNCPCRAAEGCGRCGGHGTLTDRRGVRFPVMCSEPGGCSELLNSVPLYLADRLRELPSLDFLLLHFTDETPERVAAVLREYRTGGVPPAAFTRGLTRRGVE